MGDLEREIKKLHRLGYQIKSWLRQTDVKDKDQLNDYKKKIDVRYKRGKEFYRDGVSCEPKDVGMVLEADRQEMLDFLTSSMDTLQVQMEGMEADLIQLEQNQKKKGGLKPDDEEKKDNLDNIMSSSKWHIDQMDKVLRLLRNGVLSVEDVEQVKYGIEYYVESNQLPDFAGADMELFECLGIEGLGELDEDDDDSSSSDKATPKSAPSPKVQPADNDKKKEQKESSPTGKETP